MVNMTMILNVKIGIFRIIAFERDMIVIIDCDLDKKYKSKSMKFNVFEWL